MLVVDDDELVRRSLERALGARVDVQSAESPLRAREVLAAGPEVEAVVSDQAMLDETGLSLLLAAAELCPDAVLVLFSSAPPPEAYRALDEGKLDAVFRKPDDAAALVDFVLRSTGA